TVDLNLDAGAPGIQTTLVVSGQGTWSVDPLGNVTFTPLPTFHGDPTPIPYTVSDATGLPSNEATITIDYVPVATSDISTNNTAGTAVIVPVLGNDTTGDAAVLDTVQIVGTDNPGDPLVVPGEGTWSVDTTTGAITFTPEELSPGVYFTGDPTPIQYTVQDDDGNTSNPATVTIDYNQSPPVANADESLHNPAGPVTLLVTGNDTDPNFDLDPSTVDLNPTAAGIQNTLVVAGQGTWSVDASGHVTFTPESGFTGDPTPIPYTVSDATGLVSNQATITIDYVPVADDDASGGNATGATVTVPVLANDTTGDTVDPTSVQILGADTGSGGLIKTVTGQGVWTVDPITGAITFDPEPTFTGNPTPIQYTVEDHEDNVSEPAWVTVTYLTSPPVAVDNSSLGNPAGPVMLNVTDNDYDMDDDLDEGTVQFVGTANPGESLYVTGEGTWSVTTSGDVTFTPDSGFTGDPTPIEYTVQDLTDLTSNRATITIDYVPVADDDSSPNNPTGTPVTIPVLANDTTGDDVNPLTVQIVGTTNPGDPLVVPGEGTWTVDLGSGTITFTPEPGFTDDPTEIFYTVQDHEGNTSAPATVSVDYLQQPPVAVNDAKLAQPAGPVTLSVTDNDSDPNNDLLVGTVDLDPANDGIQTTYVALNEGTWTVDPIGNVTFTPADLGGGVFFNDDPTPIWYTVSDATGGISNQATITIDYVPVATGDSSTGHTTGAAVLVDVLTNDTTGDSVVATTVQIVNPPAGSTLSGDGKTLTVPGQGQWTVDGTTGAITFTPADLGGGVYFTGDPTPIQYTVQDDEGNTSNPATVTIDYNQFPPVANNDSSLGNPAGPVTLALPVTDNDTDANLDLVVSTVDLNPNVPGIQTTLSVPGQGTWSVDPSGYVTFTPQAGFTLDPTPIPYTVSDATGLVSNQATIAIDYVPVASDDSSTGNTTGTPVTISVLGNDTTGDTVDPTTVQIVGTTNPGDPLVVANEGTWTVNPFTGAITFTPESGFTGDPTPIQYRVKDAEGNLSNPATVTIDYNQLPPLAGNDVSTGNEPGTTVTLNALVNDGDPNGDLDPTTVDLDPSTPAIDTTLTVTGEGVWTVDGAGNVSFDPYDAFTEDPTPISYAVSDETDLVSNVATITVDYAPVASDDSSSGHTPGDPATVDVVFNDTTGDTVDPATVQIDGTDNPGEPLVVPGEGTWSVDPATGAITFTPEVGFTGDPTPIEYTVADDEGNRSDPATVSIDYTQTPPVAVNDESLGNPAGPVTIVVVSNDTDVDGDLDPSTVDLDPTTDGQQTTLVVSGEGTWSVTPEGAVTFTPEPTFNDDPAPITYTVSDVTGEVSNTATITIDYVPVASDDASGGNSPNSTVTVPVLDNDGAGDLVDPTTVQIVGTPEPGDSLVVPGEGTWSVVAGEIAFDPEEDFTGNPTPIQYTVDDADGNTSEPANVTVTYGMWPPVAVDDESLGHTPGTTVTLNIVDGSSSIGSTADSDTDGDLDPATVDLDPSTPDRQTTLVVAGEGTWTVSDLGVVSFAPESGFTLDPTPIPYTIRDEEGLISNRATITIDYVPISAADTSSGNTTGTPVTVDVLGNDTTGDTADPLTVEIVDPPAGSTLSLDGKTLTVPGEGVWTVDPATGEITFTPEAGFTEDPTPISYTVEDHEGNTSDPALVTVSYDQLPPLAEDDQSLGNSAGTTVTLSAVANDSDPNDDLDPATVDLNPSQEGIQNSLTVTGQGTWTVNSLGEVTFTPAGGFNDDPTPIPYTVSDATGLVSDPATITVDYVPVATPDSSTGHDPGDPVTVDVLDNDTTGDTVDPTTVQIVGTDNPGDDLVVPGEGTWSVDPLDGSITFTPEAGFYGDPTPISYTVEDHEGNPSAPALVTLDYDQAPPVADDDESLANPAGPVTLSVTDNDSDPDGDLVVSSVDLNPATAEQDLVWVVSGEGTWTVTPDGDVTFTPLPTFTLDPAPITYRVFDSTGLYDDATITIDYVPETRDDASGGNTVGNNVEVNVLANDTTGDTPVTATVQIVGTANPGESLTVSGEGVWSVNTLTGAITFDPEDTFFGNPTPIQYTVDDADGNTSEPAWVTVTYGMSPPVAVDNESLGHTPGTAVTLGVTGNDSDADGNLDVATVDLDPSTPGRQTTLAVAGEGTWTVDNLGSVTFTPASGFNDDPTPIPYTVQDSTGLTSNRATITIDYVPVATADTSANNPTGSPVTVPVLANDTSGDMVDPTTVQIVGTANPGDPVVVPGEGTWTIHPTTGDITFTPEPDFTGDPTPIQYTVEDAEGNRSNPAPVVVDYLQQPPVAEDDSKLAQPPGAVTLNITGNDSDPNDDLLIASVDLNPAVPGQQTTLVVVDEGTWSVDALGNVTFTPAELSPGVFFTDDPTPIPYTVSDATGLISNQATITIDYVPVATGDSSTGNTPGAPVIVDVLGNDTTGDDVDPETVQIEGTDNPGDPLVVPDEGTWTVNETTGEITFTPEEDFTGDPTPIQYTVEDAEGNRSDPATVTVDYDQEAPLAVDNSSLANPAGTVTLNVTNNDSDPDGDLDPATVDLNPGADGQQTTLVVSGEGTWSVDAAGNVTFLPEAGFTGDPTPIPYTVSDSTGLVSNLATITIDYVPLAVDDSSTGHPTGMIVTVPVLTNDTTGDEGVPSTVRIVNPPAGSTLSVDGKTLTVPGQGVWTVNATTGTITFTPATGYTGDPTPIQYTVQDDEGNTSNPAWVTIDYNQIPPVAVNDESLGNAPGAVTLNVTGNDTDANGDLSPSTVDLNPALEGIQNSLTVTGEGTWTVNASGDVTFTPFSGFTLDPTPIPYTVRDATGLVSNQATITLDYVPVASDDSSTGNTTGTPVTISVLGNDTTGDAVDPTTVQIVGTDNPGDPLVVAGEGVWTVDPTSGAITFTPETGFTGDPTPIEYTVADDEGNTSEPAAVTIDYLQIPPVANNDSSLANPPGAVTLPNVTTNDTDANGDLLVGTVNLNPASVGGTGTDRDGDGDIDQVAVTGQGTWTVDPSGNVTFTPVSGFTLDPTPITYTVSDATGLVSNPATITVDYRPVAANDTLPDVIPTGTPATVNVLTNDTAGDTPVANTVQIVGTAGPGQPLTVAGQGTWSVNTTTGAITFMPQSGYTGDPTPIQYTVRDNDGSLSNPATVTLDYNQPPDAVNDSASTYQSQPVTVPVLNNDTDPENDPVSLVAGSVSDPPNGSVAIDDNGTPGDPTDDQIVYTPDPGFSGTDTFTYTISDGNGGTDTATVTVTVLPNAPPVIDLDANNSSGATGANYVTSFAGTGIPIADLDTTITDVDSAQMSQAVITLTNPQVGDSLSIPGTLPAGITATISPSGNQVILSGPASIEDYQVAIELIVYDNSLAQPSLVNRNVTVQVADHLGALSNVAATTIALQTASLSGTVFNDTGSPPNGSLDTGEVRTAGVTVYLDLNGNGALDAGEPTRVTNSLGQYTFTGLIPDTYVVRELWPNNTVQTTTPNNGGLTKILEVGENATELNFGNQAVSPQVIDDRAPGFTVVSGQWQELYCSLFVNSWIHYTCTSGGDSQVQWEFTNLTPGATYRVSTTWYATNSFTSEAPFTVSGGAAPVTLDINQKVPPSAYADSFRADGIWWKDIVSAYTIDEEGTLTVSLSNDVISGCVQADAVRIIEVTTPEITVLDGGTGMVDGSTTPLDLGGSSVGVTWTRTFTIRNDGGEPLQLGELSVPFGFSVPTGLGSTTLAPGAQTTFDLQFDALQNGVTYTGDIVIGNNDNNEAPFNFPITARVGAGLTPTAQSGSPAPAPTPPPSGFVSPIEMTDLTTSTPLENVFSTVDYGSASSPANVAHQYRIDNPDTSAITVGSIVAPSGFTVSGLTLPATIAADGSATFSVTLDSDTVGSYGGEVLVSAEGGAPLFTFTVSGEVTAGGLPPLTAPLYIDNGAVGYTDTVGFYNRSLAGYLGDYDLASGDASGDYAQWEFTNLPGGTFSVATSYWARYNWTTAARYTVTIAGTSYGPYEINQRVAPSDIYDQGIGWARLGTVFTVPNDATVTVRLTDEAGGYKVVADAVRLEQLSPLLADAPNSDVAAPTVSVLDAVPTSLVRQAAALWSAADPQAAGRLANVEVIVADLPGETLGLASAWTQTIWLDADAAGQGWYLAKDEGRRAKDEISSDSFDVVNSSFAPVSSSFVLRSSSFNSFDLLTVIAHELGHVLGLDHAADEDGLMAETLPAGVRRLPLPQVDSRGGLFLPGFLSSRSASDTGDDLVRALALGDWASLSDQDAAEPLRALTRGVASGVRAGEAAEDAADAALLAWADDDDGQDDASVLDGLRRDNEDGHSGRVDSVFEASDDWALLPGWQTEDRPRDAAKR
ncbi:MAG: tandem-95 repeat protein, partial [Candidatus Anammoximicrobium sp.]|nr:tandem-95 repeat protein [Candidatus Anammoximicrobium sp.]